MILAAAAQMKELDRTAIEDRGIPSLELMERAAENLVQEAQMLLAQKRAAVGEELCPPARVVILCGSGNNGGDGIAAARLLREKGERVCCMLVGAREKMTADAGEMEKRLLASGGELIPFDRALCIGYLSACDLVVDALFGVGLKRPLEGEYLEAVQLINRVRERGGCRVLACDIPSGIHADTGQMLGEAVWADRTVTFTFAKPGLYMGEGLARSGRVTVADIGIPPDVQRSVWERPDRVEAMERGVCRLPRRPRTAHKGDFGKVFILAGSEGYTGAPILAANAAVRSGAGLVYLGVPRNIYPITAVKCDEAMPFPLDKEYDKILEKAASCDVALIGPGLGRDPKTATLIRFLLTDLNIPVVLDADGINALEGHIDVLDRRQAFTVLTPHEGEFCRVSGCTLPIGDRLTAARDFTRAHQCTLVLKGHGTVTASPTGEVWICGAGNPGMARGGSGDVLAGMMAALLAQKHLKAPGVHPEQLAARAVYYHALAGDRCAQEMGEYGMTPTDMIAMLPRIWKEFEQT